LAQKSTGCQTMAHEKMPGGRGDDRRAAQDEQGVERMAWPYRSSDSTFCWLWLACAIIAVEAWLRIWALAIAVVSFE
jgi:hypothetical protein